MEKNFSQFANPNTGEPLTFNKENNCFVDTSGKQFSIVDGVINLLPAEASAYQEHYETDAVAFDYFEDFEPVHKAESERLHQYILEQVDENIASKTILDVGCGGAWVAEYFKDKKVNLFSMDISSVNPKKAVQTFPFAGHEGIIADVFHLPFQKESLDLIIASEIMEHVESPQLFVKSLFESLKPGGTLIITTPFNEKIQHSLCIHCNKLTPQNAHLHSFKKEDFQRLIPKSAKSYLIKTVNSKLLIRTGLVSKLSFLPFSVYKFIDRLSSFIFAGKEERMLLVIRK